MSYTDGYPEDYDPEVYRDDWRYKIGDEAGYNRGIRHAAIVGLALFVALTVLRAMID